MFVGAQRTNYRFPPLGAAIVPQQTSSLGACCTACAQKSHFPPPMGGCCGSPIGDIVDFATSPTGMIAIAAAAYYFLVYRKRG